MRLKLSILLFLFCSLSVCALNFRAADGETAVMCVNGQDTLLFFAGAPHLQSTVGSVDWYYTDGTLLQTNVDEVFPDPSRGVTVNYNGVRTTAYVFDYHDYLPTWTTITAEPHCASTLLHIDGTVVPLTYAGTTGTVTYPRTMQVRYTDLAWGETENEWTDSIVTLNLPMATGDIRLKDAFYGSATVFTLYDSLAVALELADSIHSPVTEPIAVKCHLTSETTTREKEDKMNEIHRPVEVSQLSGSAPMEILFHLNPTPAADYFEWDIYQSDALIAHRMDESTRYTFMTDGIYTAKGRVYNMQCPCETEEDCDQDASHYSGEIQVTIDDSKLLVPNVFTPNGDGVNDEFRVAYRSLREFHCWVYNRWGHLVYSWDDPAKGWDGTVNGRPAAEGAYFYVIRALGNNAPKNASYGTKIAYKKKIREADQSVIGIYRLSGSVSLIRGKK